MAAYWSIGHEVGHLRRGHIKGGNAQMEAKSDALASWDLAGRSTCESFFPIIVLN